MSSLQELLSSRITFLDGGMGTCIQQHDLSEDDFRRNPLLTHHIKALKGNNELLNLSQPDIIKNIHLKFLSSGADIIETNTFNAQRISQAEYGCESLVSLINASAVSLARAAVDDFARLTGRRALVLGAVGPTSRTLSLSPSVEDPAFRAVDFDDLVSAYSEQILALTGVDGVLIETIFDTLNAKAAVVAYLQVRRSHPHLTDWSKTTFPPLLISMTITDLSGRTLSGQTVEAFVASILHAQPVALGINCALGGRQMRSFYEALLRVVPPEVFAVIYPNAGLPNELGGYDETPREYAEVLIDLAKAEKLNLVGGCCGVSPEHVRELRRAVEEANAKPREVSRVRATQGYPLVLSGLEPLLVATNAPDKTNNTGLPRSLTLVGERCNVTGSAKFRRLVSSDSWPEAVEVARSQVELGAAILDVNFDVALGNGVGMMRRFLRILATEPAIAKVPVMVDSSNFAVIVEGLKNLQGKAVVNSISLKDGETEFIRRARVCKQLGAAVVVMAFDEAGQAVEKVKKLEICVRSWRILTRIVGFDEAEIIFDCNILTVATGIKEHDNYAVEFIEAVRELREIFPRSSFSGGLSNLSFAFRGLDRLREAMHAVFLALAVQAGMNMAIVNVGYIPAVESLGCGLRTLLEDVILNKRHGAVEDLLRVAEKMKTETLHGGDIPMEAAAEAWRSLPVDERLSYALIQGVEKFIETDALEALSVYGGRVLSVIEGPLMRAMSDVGDLFGNGKMFLPEVIKSARVMKKAVGMLQTFVDAEADGSVASSGRGAAIIVATVKGDVHDIGKNIVGLVLGCNGYKVVDLGVMVGVDRILEAVTKHNAAAVGLSGLITPSLEEMVYVARKFKEHRLSIPLLIGGATTSKRHTAVKLHPIYPKTVHVLDASKSVFVLGELLGERSEAFLQEVAEEYDELKAEYEASRQDRKFLSLDTARSRKPVLDFSSIVRPRSLGKRLVSMTVKALEPFINWTPFFHVYCLRGKYPNKDYPRIFEDARVGESARTLFAEAQAMLKEMRTFVRPTAVVGIFPAFSEGDDIRVQKGSEVVTFHGLRQQVLLDTDTCACLSDFIKPCPTFEDFLGVFACQAGRGVERMKQRFLKEEDKVILIDALADRLAEAFAEVVHLKMRTEWWGYATHEKLTLADLLKAKYQGIRPAPGYPSQPDHREKAAVWKLLDIDSVTEKTFTLTESYMMQPASSVSALCFAHPDARYFSLGPIDRDQVVDYARRTECTVEETEKWLGSTVLGYT